MTYYKTPQEIEIMREGGQILSEVLWQVMDAIKPGVTEVELDQLAEKLIREHGAEPAFQKVKNYKHTICVSTNDVVVHGIPMDYAFKEGDTVGVDCGVFYKGFNTDMSETLRVSTKNSKLKKTKNEDEVDKFLEAGKRALNEAIKVAVFGNRVGHISKKIQDIIEGDGYSVVRSLIGHGVGRSLHEEPEVPGYLNGDINKTPLLKAGMTIAVEAIYNMGSPGVVLDKDGWTVRTEDRKIAGLYERTIAITEEGTIILTA